MRDPHTALVEGTHNPEADPPTREMDESSLASLCAQAMTAQQQQDFAEAERLYRLILLHAPRHAASLRNLGLLCLQKGHSEEAIPFFEQFLLLQPASVPIRFLLANTLLGHHRLEDATRHFQEVLHLDPTHAAATYHLGLALQGQGNLTAAITAFRRALTLPEADRGHILASLGAAYRSNGDLAEAETCYRAALDLEPDNHPLRNSLGLLLQERGQARQAIDAFQTILAAQPRTVMTWNNLGILFRKEGALDMAETCYRTALEIDPDFFEAWNNLAIVLGDMGYVEEAVAAYRKALAINPTSAKTHSNLIMNLHYMPASDAASLLAESRAYQQRHIAPLARQAPSHGNDPDPYRRLRIGYLSPDFRQHPVGFFWQPVMAAHNKGQFEIYCYSGVTQSDWITQRMQGWADHWRPVKELDDPSLARLIREDGIDLLVDLSGHTDGNRLPLFARRPAPIQVTAGGHCNTTGLEVIDYLVCDRFHAPPGAEVEFSETPLRLPDDYICYAPPPYAPPVSPLPALERGHITLGCFNNQIKVTPEVVSLWSAILHRLPGSRLIMHSAGLDDPKTRARYGGWFRAQGIDATRLELGGRLAHRALLAAYGEMDIALDPFPYSGGLTTLEALWMGVPVVTMTGRTFCGRHSTSHLSNAGLTALVTHSPEAYMDTVRELTHNPDGLAHLRTTLRRRMEQSPLCDGPRYTRNLELAFRNIWQQWCKS
ncbi:MAG: tetratricopeptide repeat protein [Magnetococcales bacterium]|nr:tetratricopeptide repeat protein [Magnetococcales bacterium]